MSGSSTPAEHPQQRGLAGAVEPEDDDPGAAVDREVDVGEDLERAVGLRQLAARQRRLAARRRRREAQLGDLVGLRARPRDRPSACRRACAMLLRGAGLGGLRAHPGGLARRRATLLLGVGPLALAAPLVGLALLQVGLPADVVDVERGAVRVEVEDPVDGRARAGRRRG